MDISTNSVMESITDPPTLETVIQCPPGEVSLTLTIPVENDRRIDTLREKSDIEQYVKNQMEDIQSLIEDVIEVIGTTPDTTYTVFVRTALIRLLGEWVALNKHPVATPTLPVISSFNRTRKSPSKNYILHHIRESLENEIDSAFEKSTTLPKIV